MKHKHKRNPGHRCHPTGPPLNCEEQENGADCAAPKGGKAIWFRRYPINHWCW